MQSKEPDIKAKNTIVNKIKNGSSLFANFISHAVTASPKVQKNFLEVTTKVAGTIQKIWTQRASAKMIFHHRDTEGTER